jgi:hypothetical protein
MKRIFLISPLRGEYEANLAFAKRCAIECLVRGENPFAPHLYFTQFLDDSDPKDRQLGMTAGREWMVCCAAAVCYVDRGISSGMRDDLNYALQLTLPIEFRILAVGGNPPTDAWLHQHDVPHPKCALCEMGNWGPQAESVSASKWACDVCKTEGDGLWFDHEKSEPHQAAVRRDDPGL